MQDKLCSKQTQPLLQTDLHMCIRGPAKNQMTFDLQTILVQDQTFHLSNHAQEVTQLLALEYIFFWIFTAEKDFSSIRQQINFVNVGGID